MDIRIYNGSLTKKKFRPDYKNGSFESIRMQKNLSSISQIYLNGKTIIADEFHENDGSMAILMQILVLCSETKNRYKVDKKANFDKTLLDFAATKGFHKKLFDRIIPKIAEVSIENDPITTATIVGLNGRYRLMIKDRPETLLGRCDKSVLKGKTNTLTTNMIARIQNIYHQMTSDGLEVVMIAFKDLEKLPIKLDSIFHSDCLTLVGMIGLHE